MDPAELFNKITASMTTIDSGTTGRISLPEFRLLEKPLVMSTSELEKAFLSLDSGGGSAGKDGKAFLSVQDIAWLMKLPKLVDEQAVSFPNEIAEDEPQTKVTPVPSPSDASARKLPD